MLRLLLNFIGLVWCLAAHSQPVLNSLDGKNRIHVESNNKSVELTQSVTQAAETNQTSDQDIVEFERHQAHNPSRFSSEWWANWLYRFIDDPIILFTLVLAISTVLLWLNTRGLRKLANSQSHDIKESLNLAERTAAATMLQTRASVAVQIPKVAFSTWKLALEPLDGNSGVDPVPPGVPPAGSQPVFCFKNTGPTSIVLSYWAIKWQISAQLTGEPNFGDMAQAGLVLEAGDSHCITSSERINFTPEELRGVQDGTLRLWAYGFIIYHDFLDEMHQIGICVKWDNSKGFLRVHRENYSYQKHENSYTKVLS